MLVVLCFFFFKQKTAYERRISDWSSDVCSSDLSGEGGPFERGGEAAAQPRQIHIMAMEVGDHRQAGQSTLGGLGLQHHRQAARPAKLQRSEERRVGKECVVRVDLGGCRIIKTKKIQET